jgi:membrane protease YdiL (CAAX protease family)
LFGKTYASAGSALVLSSFTFGWIHPAQPIVKTIAGFLLGSIYLWGWKKNIAASSLAHFGANLIGTFLVLFV